VIKVFSENVVLWLIENGTVDKNEKDLYSFGIRQGLIQVFSMMSIVLVSILINGVIEMILFLAAFIPLRIYAGGYHAEKELNCYILSTVTCVVAVLAIKFSPFSFPIYTLLLVMSAVVIFKVAPVSAVNKLLDKKEKKVFGIRTRIIVLIESVSYCALAFFGMEKISKVIFYGFLLMVVTLLVGQIKLKRDI
jgi:accessory gene regulator B